MLRRTMCVLFAIAAPFLCTTTPIWAAPAQTAAACSAAPKPTAPQGNHWYYRRDRATQRRCWFLAPAGQKVQGAAPRLAAPASVGAEPAPATAPPTPSLVRQMRLAETLPAEPVDTPDSPSLAPAPTVSAAETKQEPTSALQDRAWDEMFRSREARLMQVEERPTQPPVSAAHSTPAAASSSTFQFGLLAVAIGFFTGSVFYLTGLRRRRTQAPIVEASIEKPSPIPALLTLPTAPRLVPTKDDAKVDEERLRLFAHAWKRQTA